MQTARDSQGSIKSPNTVLEDHMEWIDVAGCLAFRAYSLPRIAKFGVGVVWRVGLFTQWIREGCLSQRSYSRAGRNVVGCGRARFLREHVTGRASRRVDRTPRQHSRSARVLRSRPIATRRIRRVMEDLHAEPIARPPQSTLVPPARTVQPTVGDHCRMPWGSTEYCSSSLSNITNRA